MKNKMIKAQMLNFHRRAPFAACVAIALCCWAIGAGTASAATNYWDNNGSSAGFGVAGGIWGTDAFWSADSTGVAAPSIINPALSDDLNFGYLATGLSAGTIAVGAGSANSLTFAAGSGAITLTNGTIAMAAASVITVNNAADTISSVIAGAATSLTKAGTGTVTLNGTNTYSGGTIISAGKVIAGNTNALGTAGTITLGDANTGTNTIALVNNFNVVGGIVRSVLVSSNGSGTVTLSGGYANASDAFTGPITLQNRDITLNALNNNFNGGFSGTGNVTVASASSYSVNFGCVSGGGASNTFLGNLNVITGAILKVGGSYTVTKSLIPDTATVVVLGSLNLAKGGNSETIDALTGNGTVALGATGDGLIIGSAGGSGTFGGWISGAGYVTKIGAGTQTITTNTYSGGTTVSNGVLALGAGGSISNTPWINLAAASVTLDVSAVSFILKNGQEIKGIGQVKGGVTLAAGSRLTAGYTNGAGLLTFQNNLTLGAGATNAFKLGSAATPGTTYAQVTVGGTLNMGGVQWSDFSFTTNAGFGPGTYVLLHGATLSGALGSATNGGIGTLVGSLSLDAANTNVLLTVSNDSTPPTPNPMGFLAVPAATGPYTIVMTASNATDPSGGVQYFFSNTVNGVTSGWQAGQSWTNTGLTPSILYGYVVQARDILSNATVFSSAATATTFVPDMTPPTPNPMTFSAAPAPAAAHTIAMTATTATDDYSNPVQYFFTNTVNGNSSGWQSSPNWTDTGLSGGTTYGYQVKARDAVSNETSYSSVATATASDVAAAGSQFATGSFTWGTDAKWAATAGGPYNASWVDGNNAIFEGSAGSVTVAVSGVSVQNIAFTNTTGFLITNNTLTLAGTAPTITVKSGLSATIASVIAGSVGLVKSGTGTLTLGGTNAYQGGTVISAGTLVEGNASALSSTGTVTLGDAGSGTNNISLLIGGLTIVSPVTVANQGSGVVTLGASGGKFGGPITLHRGVSIASAYITNGIAGTGDVTISGGIVTFNNSSNTFAGQVTIAAGAELDLNNGGIQNCSFLPDASVVNVTGVLYNVNHLVNETIGALNGNGIVKGYDNTFTIGYGNSSGLFSGSIINGAGVLGLIKIGSGTQTLSGPGTNTYTGVTIVSNGTLLVNGKVTGAGAVTVNGGMLGGTGLVAGALSVAAGGTLSPGDPAVSNGVGRLTVSNNVTLASNATYAVRLAAGGLADKLISTGTISNQNATLSLAVLSDNPQVSAFTIMVASNIVGTFNGLPEGAGITASGRRYVISYPGNTNVVLTSTPLGTAVFFR